MAESTVDAPTSKRFARLRDAHQKMIETWKRSLDASTTIAAAYPTIAQGPAKAALASLYAQCWEHLDVNVMVRVPYFAHSTLNGLIDLLLF